jgi:hypothetical protein
VAQVTAIKAESVISSTGLPARSAWDKTTPIFFCTDWRGENADPQRETQARFLWSGAFLFVQFLCHFREVYVYEGGDCRRDELWLRDVVELFIRPGTDDPRHYKEFEISPYGHWLDLGIDRGQKSILYCDLKSRVRVDVNASIWSAELAIPFNCLTAAFNPDEIWRLNVFRIEGSEPNRFYSAWCPTYTPKPNFHVPEHFGELHFANP